MNYIIALMFSMLALVFTMMSAFGAYLIASLILPHTYAMIVTTFVVVGGVVSMTFILED